MLSCPNCGGNLTFDISAQQMKCGNCRTLFDPYAFDDKTSDAEEQTGNDYETTVFTCPQCGGELLSTDNAAAAFCSFCGASTILYSRINREKRPDYILPFKLTKDDCKKEYARRLKRAWFAPKELRDPAYIDSFRGIYMPYWAFYISQRGPISVNGKRSHRRGDYIITDHYALTGDLDAYYKGLSYDASSSFTDNISEALAPYDLKEMKAFTPAYLSGFYADTADVDAFVYEAEAEAIAVQETGKRIGSTAPFSSYAVGALQSGQLNTKTEAVDAAMLPVWFLSYRRGDRVAYATVNGQTGKIAADIPVDPKRYLAGSVLLAVPIFLLLLFFATLLPTTLVTLCIALSVICAILYGMECSAIRKKDNHTDDRGLQFAASLTGAPPQAAPRVKKGTGGVIVSLIAAAVCLVIRVLNPVSDLYYYAGAAAALAATLWSMADIIKAYNVLSTRRLPQFNKQGGDDRA